MKLRRSKPEDEAEQQEKKPKGLEVSKFEIVDNAAKFYTAKGLTKKQWVVVREIPLADIEHVEKFGNELTVTWKGVNDSFFTKEKIDLFGGLQEQVDALHETQQKTAEVNGRATLRRSELLEVINSAVSVVDLLFDALIGLQEKRINWTQMETFSSGFTEKLNFNGQTLPPLNLDYSKIDAAVKTQVPKDASKEALDILKKTYEYFNGLNPEEDIKETAPSFETAKTLISAYLMLNDLLLGKAVGEKDNQKETSALQAELQRLAEAKFTVDFEDVKRSIEEFNLAENKQNPIDNSRAIFKEQLKKL
jgi:hypothetical protein